MPVSHASRAGRAADGFPQRSTIGAPPSAAASTRRPRGAAGLGSAPAAGTLLAGVLLAGVLLAGCGSAAPAVTPASESQTSQSQIPVTEIPVAPPSVLAQPTAPPVPPAPTSLPAAAPKPRSTPAAGAPERVTLPWPAATTAEVRALQASVDSGSEPWLLDPTEVAMSYVSAAHGWTAAQAQARPGGKAVDVQKGAQKLLLTLDQPGLVGGGGIWVVTAETPSG